MLPDGHLERGIHSWPVEALRAELARRQDVETAEPQRPACGSGNRGAYNTPVHALALLLILALSTTACAFPVIVRRYPKFPVPHQFIFLSRHFGTGVLIATAFVHLFPTAYTSLTDPCLPPFWNERYPPMAGLIAMVSVFAVVAIEQFFAMRGAKHSHGSGLEELGGEEHGHSHRGNGYAQAAGGSLGRLRAGSLRRKGQPPQIMLGDVALHSSRDNLIGGRSPSVGQPSPSPQAERRSADEEEDELDLDLDELNTNAGLLNGNTKAAADEHEGSAARSTGGPSDLEHAAATDDAARSKALLQCLLLEAGILFHSIFIGMALSVTTGPAFAVLLVAISFHQTFEGLALGARIAALQFPPGSVKPWLMALAYGTTTPIGQAIGLVIHRSYDPASETGLLTVGVMNAVSSGLLLFAGLVQLLAEDFLSDASYASLKGVRRLKACASVLCGAALMALVGAWA